MLYYYYFLVQEKGIHVKNVMEFTATLELSAPRDVSKMYNFVSSLIQDYILIIGPEGYCLLNYIYGMAICCETASI
jgi:hypothetical protein